jgi:hypothetical protein
VHSGQLKDWKNGNNPPFKRLIPFRGARKIRGCLLCFLQIYKANAFLNEYYASLGGTATALLSVGGLLTWMIQYRFNRELENYKAGLQMFLADHNKELQKELLNTSNELNAANKRQEILLEQIHPIRLKAASESYAAIMEIIAALSDFHTFSESLLKEGVNRDEIKDEHSLRYKRNDNLIDTFHRKQSVERLYFSAELSKEIFDFVRAAGYANAQLYRQCSQALASLVGGSELKTGDTHNWYYPQSDLYFDIVECRKKIEEGFKKLMTN